MGRPQEQELQRSGNTPLDPDHVAAQADHHPHAPVDEPHHGPVPPDNQPGHHPDHDQDKPDLDAFAERMGIPTDDHREHGSSDDGDAAEQGSGSPDGGGGGAPGFGPTDAIRAATSVARGLAEPVVHLVQEQVSRAARMVEDRHGLAERVEHLERQVSELTERLEEQQRAS